MCCVSTYASGCVYGDVYYVCVVYYDIRYTSMLIRFVCTMTSVSYGVWCGACSVLCGVCVMHCMQSIMCVYVIVVCHAM